jgi:hypothetical protein
VHPIWSPLEKLPISSEQSITNTLLLSRKDLMPSRKSSTTWRLSTSPLFELLHPCTSCPERSRLWESRWFSLVKGPTRSLVVRLACVRKTQADKQDTSTSTLLPTPKISTRNVSSESRTCTLPIVYVPTNLQWPGALKLEYHSWTRSSWKSP